MTGGLRLPVVDESRCLGHGHCAAPCPTGALEVRGGFPWLPRPAACVGCGACAAVCPTTAIRLEPPKLAAEPRGSQGGPPG